MSSPTVRPSSTRSERRRGLQGRGRHAEPQYWTITTRWAAAAGVASSDARGGGAYYPGNPTGEAYVPLTKITVLSLDDNGNTQVTREVYFEGGYLDSRRVGPHVRTVLQGFAHGPKLLYGVYELYPQPEYDPNTGAQIGPQPTYPQNGSQMIADLEKLRTENLTRINNSKLDDWLPYTFVKNAGGVAASTVACEDFVPTAGSTERHHRGRVLDLSVRQRPRRRPPSRPRGHRLRQRGHALPAAHAAADDVERHGGGDVG
jgi:hypothetical protein